MNATDLKPKPTSYPLDYATYDELSENNSEDNIFGAINVTFSNLIRQGPAPIQSSNPDTAYYPGNIAGVVGTLVVIENTTPGVSDVLNSMYDFE